MTFFAYGYSAILNTSDKQDFVVVFNISEEILTVLGKFLWMRQHKKRRQEILPSSSCH